MNHPTPPAIAAPGRSLRILYADDMRELRNVTRLALTRDGHGIECVEDGLLALMRVTDSPVFDLVITDHHMPKMNGLELVTALRALEFPGKFLVLSSQLSPTIADEYQRLLVDRILYKPARPSVLRRVLKEMFPGAAHPSEAERA